MAVTRCNVWTEGIAQMNPLKREWIYLYSKISGGFLYFGTLIKFAQIIIFRSERCQEGETGKDNSTNRYKSCNN